MRLRASSITTFGATPGWHGRQEEPARLARPALSPRQEEAEQSAGPRNLWGQAGHAIISANRDSKRLRGSSPSARDGPAAVAPAASVVPFSSSALLPAPGSAPYPHMHDGYLTAAGGAATAGAAVAAATAALSDPYGGSSVVPEPPGMYQRYAGSSAHYPSSFSPSISSSFNAHQSYGGHVSHNPYAPQVRASDRAAHRCPACYPPACPVCHADPVSFSSGRTLTLRFDTHM